MERRKDHESVIAAATARYFPPKSCPEEEPGQNPWPPPLTVEHEESPLYDVDALYRAYKAAVVRDDEDPIVSLSLAHMRTFMHASPCPLSVRPHASPLAR